MGWLAETGKAWVYKPDYEPNVTVRLDYSYNIEDFSVDRVSITNMAETWITVEGVYVDSSQGIASYRDPSAGQTFGYPGKAMIEIKDSSYPNSSIIVVEVDLSSSPGLPLGLSFEYTVHGYNYPTRLPLGCVIVQYR